MDNSTNVKPRFQIERFYIKEINCKVPRSPQVFIATDWANAKPITSFELQIKHQALTATHYEIVLYITAISKLNESTAFTLDIQQAGIFNIEGHLATDLPYLLNAYCPTLLYPYAARAVAEASLQAGFPPLLLSPINFDHLYQQQLAKQAATKENNENLEGTPKTSTIPLVEAAPTTVQ